MSVTLLNNLVLHAYDTVPYYKNAYSEFKDSIHTINTPDDLVRLPVLMKDCIKENPNAFLSLKYLHFPYSKDLTINRTSGSTGTFLKIYWSKKDLTRSLFHLWNVRNRSYGISPEARCCTFHSTIYINNRPLETAPETELFNNGRTFSISKLMLDDANLSRYYEKILEYQPEWLLLQPSVAYTLADFISHHGRKTPSSLRYIELTGEYLFDNYREKIINTFNVSTANQYGCIEANSMAIKCSKGSMHCLNNNAVLEVIKNGEPAGYGSEGEIVVTCLENTTMPFIRYKLGDRGILYPPEACSCGNPNPVLKLLAGRVSEFVTLEGREPVNSFVFIHAIESINSQLNYPIIQFQITQETYCDFTCILAIEHSFKGWENTIANLYIDEMSKIGFGKLNWKVNFADRIATDTNSGKLQFFINKVKPVPEKNRQEKTSDVYIRQ